MKALDLGTGYDPERFFPGADLCGQNMDEEFVENYRGLVFDKETKVFAQRADTETPLPVPDGTYDLVWYSYGLYSNDLRDRQSIADEITRITKPRATLVLRDYTQWYSEHDDELVNIPLKQWIDNIDEIFSDWEVSTFAVDYDTESLKPSDYDEGAFCVVVILKKGWG